MLKVKQFDIYVNPDLDSARFYPYLIILQYFDNVDTRITGPMALLKKVNNLVTHYISPIVIIDNQQYVVLTSMMTHIRTNYLKTKISNITNEQLNIKNALDRLFFF